MLGGTRSGKSGYAEELLPADAPVRYLATARRVTRTTPSGRPASTPTGPAGPPAWTTVEDPDVAALVRAGGGPLLVDDLATWLTGVLDDAGRVGARPVRRSGPRVAELVDAVRAAPGRVVLVSAEVGLGVVPATRAGRLFRDELGALNAALARVCDEVLLLVAGLPCRAAA